MVNNEEIIESNRQKARRNAKNSVFIDLFNIPKYQLQLYRALHPEDTEITEDDIELITLNPVLLNLMYNDLGMLIKDKLLIFVEAQSTWSINILIRILLYLAMTWQEYITDHEINVYGSKLINIPKPEFYVVYTGSRKIDKSTVSLREDFFCDAEASVDLRAKVINSENKEDIIGQYIIFCHVMDQQVRQYGRTRKAVEQAIRICSDEGVLKEYLNSRKKEVIDVMITLFSQEYAVDAYAKESREEGREEGIQIGREEGIQIGREEGKLQDLIEIYQEDGYSYEETVARVMRKYGLQRDAVEEYMNKYWK